ncbi:ferric reductase NAD binding domain-containing protein, partial [Scleroderma yunnanense]
MSVRDFLPPNDGTLADQRAQLYPTQVWYGIGLFLFIIGLFNWTSILYLKFSRPHRGRNIESFATSRSNSISFRRFPVALLNTYRVIAFRWTLYIGNTFCLNTAEITLTVAYVVYMYIWAFINTTSLEGEKLDWTYWSTRITMLATSQFPLIAALSTKNNLVSLITGVSFERLNYLHRMMARVVFTMIWVHASTEIIYTVPTYPSLNMAWLVCGITAITAFSTLVIISLRPIRIVAYEFFFYAHCTLVLVILICAYFHAGEYQFNTFIWPAFVIWGLDRVIRIIRLVIFNHFYFGTFPGAMMDATIELQSEEYVRLRLRRPPHFHWLPGQIVYLIMPSVSRLPFEAHPFTIASMDSVTSHPSCTAGKSTSKWTTKETSTEQSLTTSSLSWKELVFFINVRNGFTLQLKEAAMKGEKLKTFIDGPYGIPPDLRSYDTSILVAGGTGISYILPTFLSIIENVNIGDSSCQKVVFVWVIRDASFINWIDEPVCKALQLVPPSLAVSIRIHVTRKHAVAERDTVNGAGRETLELPAVSAESTARGDLLAFESVKTECGRPDLIKMLGEEVQSATGKLSVSVCGSPGIAQTVRQALRPPVSSPISVLHGGPSVSLFVETYGYA